MPKSKKYNYATSSKTLRKRNSKRLIIALLSFVVLIPLTATSATLIGRETRYKALLGVMADFSYDEMADFEKKLNSLPIKYKDVAKITADFALWNAKTSTSLKTAITKLHDDNELTTNQASFATSRKYYYALQEISNDAESYWNFSSFLNTIKPRIHYINVRWETKINTTTYFFRFSLQSGQSEYRLETNFTPGNVALTRDQQYDYTIEGDYEKIMFWVPYTPKVVEDEETPSEPGADEEEPNPDEPGEEIPDPEPDPEFTYISLSNREMAKNSATFYATSTDEFFVGNLLTFTTT